MSVIDAVNDESISINEKENMQETDLDGQFPDVDSIVSTRVSSKRVEDIIKDAMKKSLNLSDENAEQEGPPNSPLQSQREENVSERNETSENPSDVENTDIPRIPYPQRAKKPISEYHPHWYTMVWPHLFPYGTGDFNAEFRGKKPSFLQWIRHCSRWHDDRFNHDSTFMLIVTNQHVRRKQLTMGNVIAKNDPEVQNLDVATVKQAFKENSPLANKILSKLSYYGQTIKACWEIWLHYFPLGVTIHISLLAAYLSSYQM